MTAINSSASPAGQIGNDPKPPNSASPRAEDGRQLRGMFGQWRRLRNSDSVLIASALDAAGRGRPTGNDLDPRRAFICKNARSYSARAGDDAVARAERDRVERHIPGVRGAFYEYDLVTAPRPSRWRRRRRHPRCDPLLRPQPRNRRWRPRAPGAPSPPLRPDAAERQRPHC
jgi:hypothetical protein